jgi:hypothetical protein
MGLVKAKHLFVREAIRDHRLHFFLLFFRQEGQVSPHLF